MRGLQAGAPQPYACSLLGFHLCASGRVTVNSFLKCSGSSLAILSLDRRYADNQRSLEYLHFVGEDVCSFS